MIQQESLNTGFIHTWSDDDTKVIREKHSGSIFIDAIDNPDWGCEYEEINIPIKEEKEEING